MYEHDTYYRWYSYPKNILASVFRQDIRGLHKTAKERVDEVLLSMEKTKQYHVMALRYRYIDRLTLAEIGERMHYTKERARQSINYGLRILRHNYSSYLEHAVTEWGNEMEGSNNG